MGWVLSCHVQFKWRLHQSNWAAQWARAVLVNLLDILLWDCAPWDASGLSAYWRDIGGHSQSQSVHMRILFCPIKQKEWQTCHPFGQCFLVCLSAFYCSHSCRQKASECLNGSQLLACQSPIHPFHFGEALRSAPSQCCSGLALEAPQNVQLWRFVKGSKENEWEQNLLLNISIRYNLCNEGLLIYRTNLTVM